jgi:SAM-dependent methyltransferase
MTVTDVFHLGLMAELNDAYNEEDAPEIDHYHRVIAAGAGPALDAGCGPGRLLRRCLAAGLDVDGSDISPDMLAICRRRCEAAGLAPTLHLQSTARLDVPRRYRTIVMSGSFALNGTRADDVAALRRVHDHLLPRGRLTFDVEPGWSDPYLWGLFAEPDGLPTSWREGGPTPTRDGATIVSEVREVAIDRIEQSYTRDLRLCLVRDGETVATEVHRLVARWYGVHELLAMLTAAGFVDVGYAEERLWPDRGPMHVYSGRRP